MGHNGVWNSLCGAGRRPERDVVCGIIKHPLPLEPLEDHRGPLKLEVFDELYEVLAAQDLLPRLLQPAPALLLVLFAHQDEALVFLQAVFTGAHDLGDS